MGCRRAVCAGCLRAAVAGFVVLLVACSDPVPDAIRIGVSTAPVTLDPRYATDAASYRIVRLLHRQLVDFDAAANPVPDLATVTRVSALEYRAVLDGDARFSDGRPVTANDVVATYRSVLDPASASPHRGSLANIEKVSALDAATVVFTLTRPDLLFPGTLVIGILPGEAIRPGTSPARFRRSSGRFEHLESGRDGSIAVRRLRDGLRFEFHTVKDATVRALRLVKGELDIVQGDIPPEQFEWLSRQPGLVGQRHDGATFSYLGFNLESGATAKPEVRRAIAHAIDRDAIIEHLFRGHARVANALFPPSHWAGAADPGEYPHDPARARALLADAGYGGGLSLSLKTSSDYFRIRVATVLKSQLAEAGVDVDILSLDWGTFYGDVKRGRFETYALSWVGLKLPDIFRHAFHSGSVPPRGANRGRYDAAGTDRLIEAAEREDDRTRRVAIYHALQTRLLYDLPYVPLWFEDQLAVMRDDIVGYTTTADGHFDALASTYRKTQHAGR